jgi:dimethylhistidine N-methyltransferase
MHTNEPDILDARRTFATEILEGLRRPQKRLPSKYFYDARGDEIFQRIMHAPAYYLFRAERQILSTRSEEIARQVTAMAPAVEVAELGPGDATKSIFLLRELALREALSAYRPIDISAHIIDLLSGALVQSLPGIPVHGLQGDYTAALAASPRPEGAVPRLILMLGANIGNFPPPAAVQLCRRLRELSRPGDMLLIGIDLKKDPRVVLEAYDDPGGLTRAFNLNLLRRINREAPADFEIDAFSHFPTYDPETGACKSFLVSEKATAVTVAGEKIHFRAGEAVLTEISQKYSLAETLALARESGFEPAGQYFDEKKWFVDCLWKVPG